LTTIPAVAGASIGPCEWAAATCCCSETGACEDGHVDRELAQRHNGPMLDVDMVGALANDKRLRILEWLKDPVAHFPPQRDGDLVRDGVCGVFIAEKLGVSQPTAGEHLKILARVGLVRGTRIKQWVFYRRDEERIAAVKRALQGDW
jgi:DNA-binding transcriptional ArsR family regulator